MDESSRKFYKYKPVIKRWEQVENPKFEKGDAVNLLNNGERAKVDTVDLKDVVLTYCVVFEDYKLGWTWVSEDEIEFTDLYESKLGKLL